MTKIDRQFLHEEARRRLLSFFEHASRVKQLVPWLRPGLSPSDLRRTVARLRRGAIPTLDPRIPPAELADAIEASIAQEEVARTIAMEALEYRQLYDQFREQERAERLRAMIAGFHALKKSPEARHPDSPAAQEVRRLHRARRQAEGRKRKRKG